MKVEYGSLLLIAYEVYLGKTNLDKNMDNEMDTVDLGLI